MQHLHPLKAPGQMWLSSSQHCGAECLFRRLQACWAQGPSPRASPQALAPAPTAELADKSQHTAAGGHKEYNFSSLLHQLPARQVETHSSKRVDKWQAGIGLWFFICVLLQVRHQAEHLEPIYTSAISLLTEYSLTNNPQSVVVSHLSI